MSTLLRRRCTRLDTFYERLRCSPSSQRLLFASRARLHWEDWHE
jgi:hypothetical protein